MHFCIPFDHPPYRMYAFLHAARPSALWNVSILARSLTICLTESINFCMRFDHPPHRMYFFIHFLTIRLIDCIKFCVFLTIRSIEWLHFPMPFDHPLYRMCTILNAFCESTTYNVYILVCFLTMRLNVCIVACFLIIRPIKCMCLVFFVLTIRLIECMLF